MTTILIHINNKAKNITRLQAKLIAEFIANETEYYTNRINAEESIFDPLMKIYKNHIIKQIKQN